MPSTGTTSCHPKNWLCRSERHPALDTQNYTVTLNTSLTRPTTRCHLNILLNHHVSKTNKPKHHESCSTKNKPYSKLQIKTFVVVCVKAEFRNSFVCLKIIVLSSKPLYIYIYIYIYIHAYLSICMRSYYTYLYVHINYTWIYTYLYAHTYVCTHTHIRVYIIHWTRPGDNTPRDTNYMATCRPSRKLYKLDEPDTQDTAGEARTSS